MNSIAAYTARTIEQQAQAFLKAFIFDFSGSGFGEVLAIKEEFRNYLASANDTDCEIDRAHRFLEARGETVTVQALRERMRASIDADRNDRLALLEYLLYKYNKTTDEFLNPPFEVPAELMQRLDEATAAHNQRWAERRARDALYRNLEATANRGGVKGMRAKAELSAARARGWTHDWNKAEVTSGAASRKASRAVAKADHTTLAREALAAEQARLACEQAKREKAEQMRRELGRSQLRVRAALWEAGEGAIAWDQSRRASVGSEAAASRSGNSGRASLQQLVSSSSLCSESADERAAVAA